MTNVPFPIKTRKDAGLESKINENYHEMWNVNLPELPKF